MRAEQQCPNCGEFKFFITGDNVYRHIYRCDKCGYQGIYILKDDSMLAKIIGDSLERRFNDQNSDR